MDRTKKIFVNVLEKMGIRGAAMAKPYSFPGDPYGSFWAVK